MVLKLYYILELTRDFKQILMPGFHSFKDRVSWSGAQFGHYEFIKTPQVILIYGQVGYIYLLTSLGTSASGPWPGLYT